MKISNKIDPGTGLFDDEKGKPNSEELKGPVENRKCTDILFFLLFIAFWAGMFVVAGFAGKNGDLGRLLYAQNSDGYFCGVDNDNGPDNTHTKYLYWPNIEGGDSICVKHCYGTKSEDNVLSENEVYTALALTNQNCGSYAITLGLCEESDLVDGCCPYKTKSFFYRCVPNYDNIYNLTSLEESIHLNQNGGGNIKGMSYLGDILSTWKYQILLAAIAVVSSFLALAIIAKMAGFIVWLFLFCIVGIMAGTAAYLWDYANKTKDHNSSVSYKDMNSQQKNSETARAFAYILIILDGLLIIAIIFLRKQIRLAVAIFREASKAMSALKSLLLVPLFYFCGGILLLIYWIYIFLLLVSANRGVSSNNNTNSTSVNNTSVNNSTDSTAFLQDNKKTINYLSIYHLFGLFWTANFLICLVQLTIAGAVAAWYFTRDKRSVGSGAVLTSSYRAIRYHCGSAAFGALIVAIVQFIRAVQQYVKREMEKKEQMNSVLKAICCCIACCLACFERFLKFVSKNSLIMVAIHGDSFCQGGRKAFKLILRNILRVASVNWVSDFLLLLVKLIIVFEVVIIALAIFQHMNQDVNFWITPIILTAIIAYFIASLFITVVEMIIDSILLCFLEDEERSRTGGFTPYMSDQLKLAVDYKEVELSSKQ